MPVQGKIHRVHHVRNLDESAYVLRFDRHGLTFDPGQWVSVGVRGSIAMREYSIYSGAQDDYLEILVREIRGGMVSRALRRCEPGDELSLEGPYGIFFALPRDRTGLKHLFVATGTGISPFHCISRSCPGVDYVLLHGIRSGEERYELDCFPASRRVTCVSRGAGGDYAGRVTAWLRENPVDVFSHCYLCGNSSMIYEAFAILRARGIPREHLYAEVYY
jgi:ferredoxin--NADP+ reductase/benzoate/toluate 1,2-dioxygenase reductase subunit